MVAALLIETKRLFKDRQFGAAFIAAPVFWAALWFYRSPQPEWGWPLVAPAQFILLVVIYPALEELVFRGALQGWLRSRSWGLIAWRHVTVANVLASVVFTLLHLIINPVYLSVAVIMPSLVFGYFRDRYDQLHASIILHIFYNAGFICFFASAALRKSG
jgi:membrane protease YdiL (CAAX protease family)